MLLAPEKQESAELCVQYIDTVSQNTKLQFFACHVFEARFEDKLEALAKAVPNNMFNYHDIIESSISMW